MGKDCENTNSRPNNATELLAGYAEIAGELPPLDAILIKDCIKKIDDMAFQLKKIGWTLTCELEDQNGLGFCLES